MTSKLKKLPIGIQNFAELINGDYLYVDKTSYLIRLIDRGKVYFLSRPRRFGKSLTVSTLEEIFKGNKELFKGLYIYDKIDWQPHPVIHIDFSQVNYKEKGLRPALKEYLEKMAAENDIELRSEEYSGMFPELIEKMSKEKQVAILIDEYDKPIIDYLTDITKAEENRDVLKSMYGCLKGLDRHIKFLFITGVTKFSKVSIFSDLNHLDDITLSEDFSTMLGYTEQEILQNFDEYLAAIESRNKWSRNKLIQEMRDYYNGYSWNLYNERVYNPFSVLKFFSDKVFQNYWFATGTPTFLINTLKAGRKLPEQIGNILVGEPFFNKFDIEKIDIVALMFQTGYLTIAKTNNKGAYWLDFPNREVEDSFMNQLLECYSSSHLSTTTGAVEYIRFALDENDWEQITQQFNVLFSSIPYQIFKAESEFYYHSIIHTALSLVGVDLHSELQTSTGRIDTVIKNEKYVYIVEFKMGTAAEALQQIKEKEYHKPFANDKRQKVLVGVGFDAEKKEVSGFEMEILPEIV